MDNLSKGLALNSNGSVVVSFDGGNIASDGGLVIYREFIEKIGLRNIIDDYLSFVHLAPNSRYTVSDKIIQQVLFQIAGYEDNNDADRLAHDPLMKILLDNKIASQPTLSRHENAFTLEGVEALQQANTALIKRVYAVEKPKVIIFDIDSTEDTAYGSQEGVRYNGHFHGLAYHPLLIYNGMNRDYLIGELRDGNVYTSNGAVELVAKAFEIVENGISRVIVRGDSGFADPKLFDLCEDRDSDYYIRLKANNVLWDLAHKTINKLDLCNLEEQVIYGEFYYKAGSWRDYRRVLVKVHKKAGELIYDVYFLCTNNLWVLPKQGWEFYQQRGNMENFIKESKSGFSFDRLSCGDFNANAARMQIKGMAYIIANLVRRLCIPEDFNSHQIETLRAKLIKVGCKIVRHGRKILVKLSSSYPYRKYFREALMSVQHLSLAT